MKHGEGELTFAKGGFYKGKFYKNEYHADNATYQWSDGSIYRGNYKEGKRSGKGILLKKDGRKYDGDWSDNMRHGAILYTDQSGSSFNE